MAEVRMNDNQPISNITRKDLGLEDKEQRKKLDPVANIQTKTKEKSKLTKFVEDFLGGSPKDVARSVLMDVIFPSAKDMIYDAIKEGIGRILYPGTRRPRIGSRPIRNYSSYNRMYYTNSNSRGSISSGYDRSYDDTPSRRGRAIVRQGEYRFDEVIFSSRDEAEKVLTCLTERIDHDGLATASDFYDLVNQDSDYTAQDWGWRTLSKAQVIRVRDGWIVDLPRTEELG